MTQERISRAMAYAQQQFFSGFAAFDDVRQTGETLRPGMQMSSYEARLIAWLLRFSHCRHVLEIGSLVGFSAITIAQSLPQETRLVTLEKDAQASQLARAHIATHNTQRNITFVETQALDWLQTYRGALFDALILDGEKKSYAMLFDAALPHLAKGALILVDNSLLFGAMLGEPSDTPVSKSAIAAMQQLHDTLSDASRFDTMLLPTLEGLTVAVKRD